MRHSEEIERVKLEKFLDIETVPKDEFITVLKKTIKRFALKSEYFYPLWQNLESYYAVDFQYSWEWLEYMIPSSELILFFEPDERDKAFALKNSRDLVYLLNESYRFTFYLVNRELTFLFCYNDHDNLFASGEAKEWLADYVKNNFPNQKIFMRNAT